MIGMSQIKKKFYIGMGIGMGIGIIGIIIAATLSIVTIKSYENGTNAGYNKKFTQKVYVLSEDLVQGQTITDNILSEVTVHKNTVPTGALTSKSSATGMVAKYNIASKIPLTSEMLTDKIVSSDTRSQEINTILMPSDLAEGNFVDLRVNFPNGTDYIVLPEKQVEKISGQTMWFNLTENERLLLNSAVVDSFLNEGTKLYATLYTDANAQVKFEEYNLKTVKDEILNLIKTEMPELLTGTTKNQVEKIVDGALNPITNTNTSENTVLADKIFDFILKYNNLTAVTKKTAATYQPNSQVMNAMKINPNISKEAIQKLSDIARSNIENLNREYERTNKDKMSGVVSGADESITAQQAERNKLLGVE